MFPTGFIRLTSSVTWGSCSDASEVVAFIALASPRDAGPVSRGHQRRLVVTNWPAGGHSPCVDSRAAVKSFETSSVTISREGAVLTIRRRAWTFFVAALACVLVGALLFGLGALSEGLGDGALAAFVRWSAYIVAGVGALFPLIGLRALVERPTVIDGAARQLLTGRAVHAFHQIERVRMQKTSLAGTVILALVADVAGKPMVLVQGLEAKHEAALLQVMAEVSELLAGSSASAPQAHDHAALDQAASARITQRFFAAFFIVLGLVWSGVGYLVMPDVAFARHDATFGFLVWPLGLFLIPLGLLELAGKRVGDFVLTAPRVRVVLAGIVWLAPYFVLAYRSFE